MTDTHSFDARDNHLLASLPAAEQERWLPQLDAVELEAGQVLHESGHPPRYAYFPLSAVASLLVAMEDGRCDEVAVVGCEGMVGASLFLGSGSSVISAVVQSPGRALRLRADRLLTECAGSTALMRLLFQYMLAQSVEIAQGVVCSRHHTVEQRLCRRLLQGLDCRQDPWMAMTQEQISGWLGVRRESVTVEAHKLQKAGLIQYSRGRITILDRAGLEARSCGCFTLVKEEYRRLRAHEAPVEPLFSVTRGDAARPVPHPEERRDVGRPFAQVIRGLPVA